MNTLNGNNGFRLEGSSIKGADSTVSKAGDINGDGFSDFIIGASNYNSGQGAWYVVFVKLGPFINSISLSSLDGTNGFIIPG